MSEPGFRCAVATLGNASVLIQVDDAVVLADPFFGSSPGISDIAAFSPTDVSPVTAIVGSHWAQDHGEIGLPANYPHRRTTAGYVADESMADSARAAGFLQPESLSWGERRRLTDTVELIFERSDRRPVLPPRTWSTAFGRLDCSPGVYLTQNLPGADISLTDALRTIGGVGRVQEDRKSVV